MKKAILFISAALLIATASCTKPSSEDNQNDIGQNSEIYGKWKPIAEWNSDGWYHELEGEYIEWLIINRDGTGSWDGAPFDFTFDPEKMTFSFWEHTWTVFNLTKDRLKMGGTEDNYAAGYEWERVEIY